MTVAVKDSLLHALLVVQQEAPVIKKTATNSFYKNSYAPLDKIVETINPILHKHGFVWTTLPVVSDHGPALTYRLAHVPSGESIEGTMPLLLSQQDAQGQGSAITYARRYALCAVLNLVAEDDDDGQRAAASQGQRSSEPSSPAGRPSEKQVEFLQNLVKRTKPTVAQLRILLAEIGAEGIEIEEGWVSKLSGGRDGQVSQLIERLKSGDLPPAVEHPVPPSDVPEPAQGDFEHPEPEQRQFT
jgi:hypothetical protein